MLWQNVVHAQLHNFINTMNFAGLELFLKQQGIPVDALVIKPFIKKDHRHDSKPNTASLFQSSTPRNVDTIKFLLIGNSLCLLPIAFIVLVIVLLACCL